MMMMMIKMEPILMTIMLLLMVIMMIRTKYNYLKYKEVQLLMKMSLHMYVIKQLVSRKTIL